MTAEIIATIVGFIISGLLEVVPGLKDVWAGWSYKRLSLLGLFVGIPVVAWVLACYAGLAFPFEVVCGLQGLTELAWVGFMAFLANGAAFLFGASKLPNALKRLDAGRSR